MADIARLRAEESTNLANVMNILRQFNSNNVVFGAKLLSLEERIVALKQKNEVLKTLYEYTKKLYNI